MNDDLMAPVAAVPPSLQRKTKRAGRIIGLYGGIIILVVVFALGYLIGMQDRAPEGDRFWSSLSASAEKKFGQSNVDPGLFWNVWSEISDKYVSQPVDPSAVMYGSIKGMVAGLGDPYSVFFDPQEAKIFHEEISNTFDGIGAEIGQKDGRIVIIAPLPDTPAITAGLLAGDQILQIDDTETSGLSVDQAVALIRGDKGTTVRLLILRADSTDPQSYTITRDTINPSSVTWEMLDKKIARITISSFTNDTQTQFEKAVTELLVQAPAGWIIDLRNNPGGYLDSAIGIAGDFIASDVAVIEESADGQRKEDHASGTGRLRGQPIVALVNQGTASAAEILAGVLQDYQLASIVGQQTFGKGTVQDFTEFGDGSGLKLTVARWLTPLGRSIQESGITPDPVVEYTQADAAAQRDPQLDRAMSILTGQ